MYYSSDNKIGLSVSGDISSVALSTDAFQMTVVTEVCITEFNLSIPLCRRIMIAIVIMNVFCFGSQQLIGSTTQEKQCGRLMLH